MASAIRISDAVSIGMHAVLCLGSDPARPWTVREIGARFHFSKAHLAKVVTALRRAGLVTAVRGPRGGARLRLPPDKITLLAIYEAIDGPMTMSDCLLGSAGCGITCCPLGSKLAGYNRAIRDVFGATTLADLAQQFANASSAARTPCHTPKTGDPGATPLSDANTHTL